MKTTPRLRRTLFLALAILALPAAAPQPARAGDAIDKFASLLDQLPSGVLFVSGQDIRDSRKFFEELQDVNSDDAVAKLLLAHKDSPIGQKAISAAGGPNDIPSWFWDLLETYIAFRAEDFWGVIEHLGTAAVCIVAQFMAAGTDVCGLIEALVELAETFEDTMKALGKFLEGIGETLADIGCAVIGGCGESLPDEYYAYEYVFKPNIQAGVSSIDVSAGSYANFVDTLKGNALSKPAKLSKPYPYPMTFGKGPVENAANMFADAVDANWEKRYVQEVLPALYDARNKYPTPQKIAELAQKTAASVQSGQSAYLATLCANEFRTNLGFMGLDRWMSEHKELATSLKVVSHNDWCLGTFWGKNKDKFAQHFRDYAKANYCPESGKTLLCPTVSRYDSCASLMGSVGLSDQCGIDVLSAGLELAQAINESFKKQGSKYYPCKILKSMSKPGSGATSVSLVCSRPTQWHACEEKAKPLTKPQPVKLVDCRLEETAQYKDLRNKVSGAVAALNKEYASPAGGNPFAVDPVDPLIVRAPSPDAAGKVKAKNPGFGFGPPSAKAGFDYLPPGQLAFPRTVDGVNTPLLGAETKLPKVAQGVQIVKMQEKVSLETGSPPGSAPGAARPGGAAGKAGPGSPASMKSAPGPVSAPPGPDLSGAPAPAPALGPAPSPGRRTAAAAGRALPSAADIRSGPRVTIGGKHTVGWGQSVTISEADARRAQDGICEVTVSHDTLNTGSAATGPFGRRWANGQNPAVVTDTYPPIPAGGSAQRTDTLLLKPGTNALTLTLDPLDQVKEEQEANNMYRVTVTVNGSCGRPPAAVPGTRAPVAPRPQLPPGGIRPRQDPPRR